VIAIDPWDSTYREMQNQTLKRRRCAKKQKHTAKQSVGSSCNGERVAPRSPTITISFKEYDYLETPVVHVILPKMGITRKAPREVVFGMARCGGIGLYHLVAVQSHDQLQYLLGHLRCQDTTGQLIHMIMEFNQMECGCTGNVLEQSYKQYTGSIINKNWITAIWAHLERFEATVK
jgi:hypothetical protein